MSQHSFPNPMNRHVVPSCHNSNNSNNNNNFLIKKLVMLFHALLLVIVLRQQIPTATAYMCNSSTSLAASPVMTRTQPPAVVTTNGKEIRQWQHEHQQEQQSISRRGTLSAIMAIASGVTSSYCIIGPPRPSVAATPMTAKEADSLPFRIERQIRIPPVQLLRPVLNLDFAVLLMRSSYNAVDELNFVPMDQFQRDFFLIRQAEYLPYADSLGPGLVKQGDLTDAYYFDFISFAQYRTIYRDMTVDPLMIFEEKQPVANIDSTREGEEDEVKQEFVTKIIQRDPSIGNSMLPQLHDEYVGSKILDKLMTTFQDTPSAIPPLDDPKDCSTRQVLKSLQQLVNLFLVNGYAFNGKVELKKDGVDGGVHGSQYIITLTAPANLWSGKSLQQLKNAKPTNDFIGKTAKVMLNRAGFEAIRTSLKYTTSEEITTIEIL
jgi:hypothetical protein